MRSLPGSSVHGVGTALGIMKSAGMMDRPWYKNQKPQSKGRIIPALSGFSKTPLGRSMLYSAAVGGILGAASGGLSSAPEYDEEAQDLRDPSFATRAGRALKSGGKGAVMSGLLGGGLHLAVDYLRKS